MLFVHRRWLVWLPSGRHGLLVRAAMAPGVQTIAAVNGTMHRVHSPIRAGILTALHVDWVRVQ